MRDVRAILAFQTALHFVRASIVSEAVVKSTRGEGYFLAMSSVTTKSGSVLPYVM